MITEFNRQLEAKVFLEDEITSGRLKITFDHINEPEFHYKNDKLIAQIDIEANVYYNNGLILNETSHFEIDSDSKRVLLREIINVNDLSFTLEDLLDDEIFSRHDVDAVKKEFDNVEGEQIMYYFYSIMENHM